MYRGHVFPRRTIHTHIIIILFHRRAEEEYHNHESNKNNIETHITRDHHSNIIYIVPTVHSIYTCIEYYNNTHKSLIT